MTTAPDTSPARRRRRPPLGLSERLYGTLAAALLVLPSLGGMLAYGGTRVWNITPLIVCACLGAALTALQPIVFRGTGSARLRIPPGWTALLALFLCAGAMIPAAAVRFEARFEWITIGSLLLAYWAWATLTARMSLWRTVAGLTLLVGIGLSLYALAQHARGSNMVLDWARPEGYGMRASATYLCPNHFAHALAILLCLAAALLFSPVAGLPLRLYAGTLFLVGLPALFLSLSRSAWLGASAGVGVVLLLLAARRSRKLFWGLFASGPLLAAGLFAVLWLSSPVFKQRVLSTPPGAAGNTATIRLNLWSDTWQMFLDQPLFGFGPGAYGWVHPAYQSFRPQLLAIYAHNEYLHFLADYGIVGGVILLVLTLLTIAGFFRLYRDAQPGERHLPLAAAVLGAITASLLQALFDFNYHLFPNNHLLVLLSGLATGTAWRARTEAPGGGRSTRTALALRIAAIGLCVLISAIAVRTFIAHWHYLKAERLAEELAFGEAEQAYRRALQADPVHVPSWRGLGVLCLQQSKLSFDPERTEELLNLATECLEAAVRLSPDAAPRFSLGMIHLLRGNDDEGFRLMREAVELAPRTADYPIRLGLQLRLRGRYAEALAAFESARSLAADPLVRSNIQWLRKKIREESRRKSG